MFSTRLTEQIMCRTKSGNKIYWMIRSESGAPNFELRYIEIPPLGKSSAGHHPHEHEVFVVAGKGRIVGTHADGHPYTLDLEPGMAVFVPGNEDHQWINSSTAPFGFVCVVPKGAEAESKPPCGE
ncbi:MAG TPA: cupin domain-containing protein [Spirochaetia bacterium]|nr:cupin domain-containing protein [Spirochaetia bacterium]